VYGALGRFWFGGADPETEEMAVHVKVRHTYIQDLYDYI
jgi:hypothetical protein